MSSPAPRADHSPAPTRAPLGGAAGVALGLAALGLLAVALLSLRLALLAPLTYSMDNPALHADGFYPTETSADGARFRWSRPSAGFLVPALAARQVYTLEVSAPRPAGAPAPGRHPPHGERRERAHRGARLDGRAAAGGRARWAGKRAGPDGGERGRQLLPPGRRPPADGGCAPRERGPRRGAGGLALAGARAAARDGGAAGAGRGLLGGAAPRGPGRLGGGGADDRAARGLALALPAGALPAALGALGAVVALACVAAALLRYGAAWERRTEAALAGPRGRAAEWLGLTGLYAALALAATWPAGDAHRGRAAGLAGR